MTEGGAPGAPARGWGRAWATRGLALAAFALLAVLGSTPWPDDWDGIGFVESVRAFDLERFQPHPPGYPVYVALLRVAAVLVSSPMRACIVVAVVSGVAAIGFGWQAARLRWDERAAWRVALLGTSVPAVWHACTGVGTEAPALACVAFCAWALAVARERPSEGSVWLGFGVGIGLGVRLSWAPICLVMPALLPRGARVRACVACVACALWGVPLVGVVGGPELFTLCARQLSGHAERWGGTIVTAPGGIRGLWLARDTFVDGFGVGSDALGLATAGLLAASATQALFAWRAAGWRGWRSDLTRIGGLPSEAWVTSEVEGGRGADHVATLCRPLRLDRRMPCLDV